jgi:hypothetical protein
MIQGLVARPPNPAEQPRVRKHLELPLGSATTVSGTVPNTFCDSSEGAKLLDDERLRAIAADLAETNVRDVCWFATIDLGHSPQAICSHRASNAGA